MEQILEELEQNMYGRSFIFRNPVVARVAAVDLDPKSLAEVLRQYTCSLPRDITRLLGAAAQSFPAKSGVRAELVRNIREEGGSETGGIPHVKLLELLLIAELRITHSTQASPATVTFLSRLHSEMRTGAWVALGQAYALEASAVPELALIICPAMNAYARMVGLPIPISIEFLGSIKRASPVIRSRDEAIRMSLANWMSMHIHGFEVGHRNRLRTEIIAASLDQDAQSIADFRHGFLHVLDCMDAWWDALANGG